jgi:hypothetical protein
VKEDVEGYLLGHAGKDVHAGYGEQWIKTLKAAIKIIPNPLQTPACAAESSAVQLNPSVFYFLGDEEATASETLQRCNTPLLLARAKS